MSSFVNYKICPAVCACNVCMYVVASQMLCFVSDLSVFVCVCAERITDFTDYSMRQQHGSVFALLFISHY